MNVITRSFGTLLNLFPVYLRYVAVSAAALLVDLGMFLLIIAGGIVPAWAASGISYLAGMVAHWLLSSRFVFGVYLARPGIERGKQQGMFLASALAGLAVTVAIVGLGDAMGFDPRLAKLVAVGVSFQAVYYMRRRIVFT